MKWTHSLQKQTNPCWFLHVLVHFDFKFEKASFTSGANKSKYTQFELTRTKYNFGNQLKCMVYSNTSNWFFLSDALLVYTFWCGFFLINIIYALVLYLYENSWHWHHYLSSSIIYLVMIIKHQHWMSWLDIMSEIMSRCHDWTSGLNIKTGCHDCMTWLVTIMTHSLCKVQTFILKHSNDSYVMNFFSVLQVYLHQFCQIFLLIVNFLESVGWFCFDVRTSSQHQDIIL